MSIESFLIRMPKVELHVHLEGTFRPATLLQLAKKNGIELPASDAAGIYRWFQFRDMQHFVEIYLTCSRCLRQPEDFQLLVRDFLAEQAMQNVIYSEVHFTISTHLANGVNGDEVRQALAETAQEGEARWGVRMRLITDIVRNVGPDGADRTLEWALAGRDQGVVAVGLSGDEIAYSNEPFRQHFEVAERQGLHRVAHAGEHGGPDSVRAVLDICRPERIGHGVRAADDSGLLEEIRSQRIPLEICPTSNLRLGVVPSLDQHPLDRLLRLGVPISINSDDPPLFRTNLTGEYLALHHVFGYSRAELAELTLAAVRQSFLPEAERLALEDRFRSELRNLRVDTTLLGGVQS